jgi:transcription elongation factor GreA
VEADQMTDGQMSLEITLTSEGHARLEAELEELRRVARPAAADALRSAYESGEDGGSAQVQAARREQERLELRIARLEATLRQARVVGRDEVRHDVARVGSTVVIRRGELRPLERYTLVGPHEGAPGQARISSQSPLGRALVGRRAGEAVSVEMPGGLQTVLVNEVRAPEEDLGPAA